MIAWVPVVVALCCTPAGDGRRHPPAAAGGPGAAHLWQDEQAAGAAEGGPGQALTSPPLTQAWGCGVFDSTVEMVHSRGAAVGLSCDARQRR